MPIFRARIANVTILLHVHISAVCVRLATSVPGVCSSLVTLAAIH